MHHDNIQGAASPERIRVDHAGLATLGAAAAGPVGLSPPQVGAPLAEGVSEWRGRDQGKTDSSDCDDLDANRKIYLTLRARFALAGRALSRTAAGDGAVTYAASRWNMARELVTLDAVAEFADRVGAR